MLRGLMPKAVAATGQGEEHVVERGAAERHLVEFLLLLPVAALVICLFRNVIGLASFGTFAPAGTPPQIISKIQTTFAEVARDPGIRDRMITLGMYPVTSTPVEFAKFLEADTQQWERVIRDAKIKKID